MSARTSYTVVGEDQKQMTYAKMIELHDKLKAQVPKHLSPFEHAAPAMTREQYLFYTHTRPGKADPVQEDLGREVEILNRSPEFGEDQSYTMERGWCDNFRGFVPYRRLISDGSL